MTASHIAAAWCPVMAGCGRGMGLQLLGAMARLHVSVLEESVGRFWLRHRLDFTLHGQISFGQAGAGCARLNRVHSHIVYNVMRMCSSANGLRGHLVSRCSPRGNKAQRICSAAGWTATYAASYDASGLGASD